MRKNNCEAVRRELDELMLDEALSVSSREHLKECAACNEFQEQQTKLRRIVGSLGTVSAPADFDYRLRARLANEGNGAGYWPIMLRAFAVVAVLVVFAVGAFFVWSGVNRPAPVREEATNKLPPQPAPQPTQSVVPTTPQQDKSVIAVAPQKQAPVVKNGRGTEIAMRPKRSLVSQDFSQEQVGVIRATDGAELLEAIPLDASLQSFKVSLDDGRGNARTISVPTVSFGSQRVLPVSNQFAQKRVW